MDRRSDPTLLFLFTLGAVFACSSPPPPPPPVAQPCLARGQMETFCAQGVNDYLPMADEMIQTSLETVKAAVEELSDKDPTYGLHYKNLVNEMAQHGQSKAKRAQTCATYLTILQKVFSGLISREKYPLIYLKVEKAQMLKGLADQIYERRKLHGTLYCGGA